MKAKGPLSEQLRDAIRRCGMTRYAISQRTGIAQSILSRFVNTGAGLSLANVDKVCECIGARLVLDADTRKRKNR